MEYKSTREVSIIAVSLCVSSWKALENISSRFLDSWKEWFLETKDLDSKWILEYRENIGMKACDNLQMAMVLCSLKNKAKHFLVNNT